MGRGWIINGVVLNDLSSHPDQHPGPALDMPEPIVDSDAADDAADPSDALEQPWADQELDTPIATTIQP